MVRKVRDPVGARFGSVFDGLEELAGDDSPIRKQVSLFFTMREWRVLRDFAARQRLPVTQVVRQALCPHLAEWAKLVRSAV